MCKMKSVFGLGGGGIHKIFLIAKKDDDGAPQPNGAKTKDDACPDIEIKKKIIARADEIETVGAEGGEGREGAQKAEKDERAAFWSEDIAGFGKLSECAD